MTTAKQQIVSFLRNFREILRKCMVRFPVTVGFSIALTAYLCYLIADPASQPSERFLVILGYYLSVGTLLSLSLHLWSEEMKSKKTVGIVQSMAHCLLIADAFFLYYFYETKNIEVFIAHGAGLFAIGLSVFFLSFFREKDDIPAWNFTQNIISNAVTALIVGGIMCGGICLLILSLHQLFGIDVSTKCYLYILTLCLELLPTLLFLGMLPQGKEKHNRVPRITNFSNGVIRYLFLPLAGGYLFILYVYLFRILLRWELPNGWVSWPVVILMIICLVIEYELYPSRLQNTQKWKEQVARRLPLLILPLLLLMSIGIIRRLSDYGITINRLYLATLNLWFYFVCIGLFKGKARRIRWIPVSFSVVLLLTSVLPVNYTSITRTVLRNEIKKEIMQSNPGKLPLSESDYAAWLKSLPTEQAKQINDKLLYLCDLFSRESFNDLVNENIDFYNYIPDTVETSTEYISYTWHDNSTITVPEGYKYCTFVRSSLNILRTDTLYVPLTFANDTVNIPLDTLRYLDKNDTLPPPAFKTRAGNIFIMSENFLSIYPNKDENTALNNYMEGILYHNEYKP